MIFDQLGNLYTTTYYSYAGLGEIWGAGPGYYNFPYNGSEGARPNSLILDQVGDLFGTTEGCGGGGGTVFELDHNGNNLKTLYAFGRSGGPNRLLMDAAGSLYGTTGGGAYNHGSAFKLTPGSSGWTYMTCTISREAQMAEVHRRY